MPSSAQRKQQPQGGPSWQVLPGGKADRHTRLGKPLVWILVLATGFRMWMALYGSQGIVTEDTFGVLRQGRNLLQGQGYVFAPGVGPASGSQPLTLFGLLLAPVQALLGRGTPVFLLAFNTVLWTFAVLALLRPMRPSVRPALALLLCLAPALVDGAVRGTDAEWLGFLLAMSFAAVSVGATARSLAWLSLAVLSAPSTCLFAPVWLATHCGRMGLAFGLRTLMRLRNVVGIAVPLAIWAWVSSQYTDYGLTEPLRAWAAGLQSPWASLSELWVGLPSFTLLPWVAGLPPALQHLSAVAMGLLLAITIHANFTQGTAASRGWLCFYLLMVAFGSGVSGSAQFPAASVLPALAFIMAMLPLLLALVPRFHETRLLKASALILLTLAMPIAFGKANNLRTRAQGLEQVAQSLEAELQSQPELPPEILTAQAGHIGFLYSGPVLWAAAPGYLPDSEATSLVHLMRKSGSPRVLVSASELESNKMESGGTIWSSSEEQDWWQTHYACYETFGEWKLFRVRTR